MAMLAGIRPLASPQPGIKTERMDARVRLFGPGAQRPRLQRIPRLKPSSENALRLRNDWAFPRL